MDGVRRIMNQKEVTEGDTGDIEQWRVLIITGIIIIIIIIIMHFRCVIASTTGLT